MTKITTIGLDLAKSVFQVHGTDKDGTQIVRNKLRRSRVAGFFSKLEPCLVGMEPVPALTTGRVSFRPLAMKSG